MATTALGYVYPAGTDIPAGHTQIQALAESVDASPGVSSLTQTEITALAGDGRRAGRTVWNETTGTIERSDGAAFATVPVVSTSTPAATSTAGAVGTGATAARADHVHALGTHNHSGSTTGGAIPQSSVTSLTTDLAARLPLAGGTLTGSVSGVTPTSAAHLTRKDYVDAAGRCEGGYVAGGYQSFAAGDSRTVTVAMTSGRFATAPGVTVTMEQHGGREGLTVTVGVTSATSFTARFYNTSGATWSGDLKFYWTAAL